MDTTYRLSGELHFGYQGKDADNRPEMHKRFVFGHRPTGKDMINTGNRKESQVETQRNLMLVQTALVEFGSMGKPPLSVLLSLNVIDRDVLVEARDQFMEESLGERTFEYVSENTVRLAFGLESDGVLYDVFEFGKLLTGYEEVELDRSGAVGWERLCLSLAKQIKSVRQSNGNKKLARKLELEDFEVMDGVDIGRLSDAQERWLRSFRPKRRGLEGDTGMGDSLLESASSLESHGDRGAPEHPA